MSDTHPDRVELQHVLESLGFEPAPTHSAGIPVLRYTEETLDLHATHGVNRYFAAVFHFSALIHTSRVLRQDVSFDIPETVDSYEQGVAWISDALSRSRVSLSAGWFRKGLTWKATLPWVLRQEAFANRPNCVVERDWLRVGLKKLRTLASHAAPADEVTFEFDGKSLLIELNRHRLIMPAEGKAWPTPYAILAGQVGELPKRLGNPYCEVSVFEGELRIQRRAICLAVV